MAVCGHGKGLRACKYINKFILFASITTGLSLSSCSFSSLPTTEGLFGTIAGAGAGAGVGYIIGDELGKKTENIALASGVGAATGLAIGAMMHEQNMQTAKEEAEVIREAKEIDERQFEIDALRKKVYGESSWGRLDQKPWHQRYETETSEYPYQGVSLP